MNGLTKAPDRMKVMAGYHSIRFKIFIISLLPTLALVFAAAVNYQYLGYLGKSADQILSMNYRSIKAAQEARMVLEETRNNLLERASNLKYPPLAVSEILKDLFSPLMDCRENITEEGEQELIDLLLGYYDQYENHLNYAVKAGADLWSNERFSEFLSITSVMIARLDDLVAINEDAMERAEDKTQSLASDARRNVVILFSVIIIAILALSLFLSHHIAKPIMNLARQLSDAKEGSGNYPQINKGSNDEIGFLTGSFNSLFKRLELYDRSREDIIVTEKEKVRRSEEAKGRFIADISHQLKTPMTSLLMSISMLHDRGENLSSDRRSRLLETARDDSVRLSNLINELVDISRLEAIERPHPKETLDVGIVLRESLAPLMEQAEQKGVDLIIEVPEDLPKLTIDSFRFPWVFTNLVGNALRYTKAGGNIRFSVNKSGSRLYFTCGDTGSGIAPQYLSRIFDRFTQFSEREKSGTIGLGLAIVKDIVEQHGGDIEVKSSLGKGTTFTFWIPYNEVDYE